MAKNPWLSLWLNAASTWAGATRGFWSAEMQRQQKAIVNDMTRPAPRFTAKSRSAKSAPKRLRKNSKG